MTERLTERFSNGQAASYWCGKNCKYDHRYCYANAENCPAMSNIFEKLARYEDLEEQNRLIELPCKIGDTVYVIPSKVNYELNIVNHHEENNRVYEQTVHSIQMFSNYRYVLATCDGLCSILSDFYKETWFLTREEAEVALKGTDQVTR